MKTTFCRVGLTVLSLPLLLFGAPSARASLGGDYVMAAPVLLTNLLQYADRAANDGYDVYGLAWNNNGYVYLSDNGSIYQYNVNTFSGLKRVMGPYPTPLSFNDWGPGGYQGYGGLATDSAGDLFFTDMKNDNVCELSAQQISSGGTNITFPSDPHFNFPLFENVPGSIAVDLSGNLFMDNFYTGTTVELPVYGLGYTNPYFLPNNPDPNGVESLTVDTEGRVYTMDSNLGIIYQYTPGIGWTNLFSTRSFPYLPDYLPNGLALDSSGNVVMALQGVGLEVWLSEINFQTNWYSEWVDAVAADTNIDIFLTSHSELYELQEALVDIAPVPMPMAGGSASLASVLPPTANLSGPFTPTATLPWITITSVANGVVNFTCQPNTNANSGLRVGAINLLGQFVPIDQAGSVYTLAATSATEPPGAGSDSVRLQVNPASGAWTAFSYASWLTVTTPQGAGSGNVSFTFSANPGGSRSGTLVIAGQHFTVTQVGAGYAAASSSGTLIPLLVTPYGVAVDPTGDVFVADNGSKTIKEWVAASGAVITVVDSGLADPSGVAVDAAGNLFIADGTGGVIYELPAGSALPAGAGALQTLVSGLGNATGVAVDAADNLFFSDTANNKMAEYIPGAGVTNLVTLGLSGPTGLAVDAFDDVFIADTGHNAIKEWSAAGGLNTLVSAGLDEPTGVAVDAAGDLYIADTGDNSIYELPAGGSLTYIADDPNGVAVDSNGNLYFSDGGEGSVDELETAYVNTTTRYETAAPGHDSLPAVSPASANLTGAFAPVSNQSWLQVTGVTNGVVSFSFTANLGPARSAGITVLGQTVTVWQSGPSFVLGGANRWEGAGAGSDSVVLGTTPAYAPWTAVANAPWLHLSPVFQEGIGATNVVFSFDANPGATRSGTLTIAGLTFTVTQAGAAYVAAGVLTPLVSNGLVYPEGVAVGASGNVYIANPGDASVLAWSAASNTTSTLFIPGLYYPQGVAVDASNNVYVADSSENEVVEWLAAGGTTVLPIAGLSSPSAVAVDLAGNVYVVSEDSQVLEWSPASGATSVLPISGLGYCRAVAVDAAGNVYVTDDENTRVSEWSPASGQTTVLPFPNLSPAGVAVDGAGNVYVADDWYDDILQWSPAAQAVTTVVSNGLSQPVGLAVDGVGNLYISDVSSETVFELPRAYVNPNPRSEPLAAGSDSLPPVLPPATDLNGPFAPLSSQSWLMVTNVNQGVIGFSFDANTGAVTRVANLSFLGQTVAISQLGPDFLSATTCTEGPQAGSDSVILVTVPEYPNWSNTANASWLHLAGNATGTGTAIIGFSFDANYGDTRTGTLTIDGMTVTVTQAGLNYLAANLQVSLIPSGLSQPSAVAVDPAGNVYAADYGGNDIEEWSPAGNSASNLFNLYYPTGVAVDSSGNVYATDAEDGQVWVWSPTNNTPTELWIPGLDWASGVAVDSSGNVYVADSWGGQVLEWSPASDMTTVIPFSGLDSPVAVAVDAAGNVYAADSGSRSVVQWSSATSATTTVPFYGLGQPAGVAVDLAGNVYVADSSYYQVLEWSVAGNAQVFVAQSLPGSSGVAVDAAGDVFIAESWGPAVVEIPRAFVFGGYLYENTSAGADALPPVLPTTANLTGPFAPANDSPDWLAITGVSQGAVDFSFSSNNGPSRTATLTVLGQSAYIYQYSPNYYNWGAYDFIEGPAAGRDSLVLGVYPSTGAWTATNLYAYPWLHLGTAYQSGTGSTNLVFCFDANPGPTRYGGLEVAGAWIGIIQAGSNYVAAARTYNLVSAGLTNPAGLGVDNSGNVYVANAGGNSIVSWSPQNNSASLLVSGLNNPQGVAAYGYDPYYDVFIANAGANALSGWLEENSYLNCCSPSYSTNLYTYGPSNPPAMPAGVAFDSLLFNWVVADSGTGVIDEFPFYGGPPTRLLSGLDDPVSVAEDAAGNAYIADAGARKVYALASGASNLTSLVSSGLASPTGVAVDGAGNVYIADLTNNVVWKWTFASNTLAALPLAGLSHPAGVAVDSSGDVFVDTDGGNNLLALPFAYVAATAVNESGAAGADSLPAVLPATADLSGPFAPFSDQPWLTVTGVTNGVVYFAFTSAGAGRTGHIILLGQSVAVTQSANVTPPVLSKPVLTAGGGFQFTFMSSSNASFAVLTSTNLELPLSEWTPMGNVSNLGNGLFQFATPVSGNGPAQYFGVRSQ